MTTLYPASASILRTVIATQREHHPELARVHIVVLMADSPETPREPIRVKVPGPLARAAGAADIALLVHPSTWDDASEPERLAMVDHALAGVTVVERDGLIRADTAGRPRIKRRRPFYQANVYPEVLERHQGLTPGASAATEIRKRIDKAKRVKVKTVSILPDSLAG